MVVDKLNNISKYIPPEIFTKIKDFLSKLTSLTPDGYYPIEGDKIFVRVMAYSVREKEECMIEAHNKYIDIQSTLTGAEGIDIFVRRDLKTETAYNIEEDVEFYAPGNAIPYVNVENHPGYFTMIFPEEAHRPMQITKSYSSSNPIKKFVIKVDTSYYEQL